MHVVVNKDYIIEFVLVITLLLPVGDQGSCMQYPETIKFYDFTSKKHSSTCWVIYVLKYL